jgi:hypothetical protein
LPSLLIYQADFCFRTKNNFPVTMFPQKDFICER